MALRCKSLITSFAFLAMTGCTIIPGSHYEGIESNEKTQNLEQELEKVNIQLIDSALITQQKKARTAAKPISSLVGVEFDGFKVQEDGTVTYAYASNIPAAGHTISELRKDLVTRLARVIENPQVDVKIVSFKSQKAYVTGEVKQPGVYPVTDTPLTLIDAINQAGGLTEAADWRTVTFTRGDKTEVIKLEDFYANGDISQNRLLQHGDIVHVNRNDKQKVFVLGDVNKAGSVKLNRYGLNLAEALSDSGGLNEGTADANGIFVLRKSNVEQTGVIADVYQLHAKNIAALVLAEQFELQPHDIVYVTSAPLARWNRVISLLLPSIATVDSVDDITAN